MQTRGWRWFHYGSLWWFIHMFRFSKIWQFRIITKTNMMNFCHWHVNKSTNPLTTTNWACEQQGWRRFHYNNDSLWQFEWRFIHMFRFKNLMISNNYENEWRIFAVNVLTNQQTFSLRLIAYASGKGEGNSIMIIAVCNSLNNGSFTCLSLSRIWRFWMINLESSGIL